MTTTDTAVNEGDLVWVPEVDFATRLRLVRREFGRQRGETLTQGDMAELVEVPKNRWQQWEAGLAYPRDLVSVARRIAEVTNVDIAWLIGLGEFDFTPDGSVSGVRGTGSRCTGGEPGGGWIPNTDCTNRHDFLSEEEIRNAVHDGPKPIGPRPVERPWAPFPRPAPPRPPHNGPQRLSEASDLGPFDLLRTCLPEV